MLIYQFFCGSWVCIKTCVTKSGYDPGNISGMSKFFSRLKQWTFQSKSRGSNFVDFFITALNLLPEHIIRLSEVRTRALFWKQNCKKVQIDSIHVHFILLNFDLHKHDKKRWYVLEKGISFISVYEKPYFLILFESFAY